ncbi:hypothetical protein E2C01_054370 [Portunus trituberculatus]|uniref:Uncharacterized protein n=1 Tax=Portunus trituberculatus TaxID=210409 RepID=A0A5B7GRU8_PORTR|nr:hypothetical protein [Portunus trituberculatus]
MGDPDRNNADVREPDCISDASLGSNETLPPGMQLVAGEPLGACCELCRAARRLHAFLSLIGLPCAAIPRRHPRHCGLTKPLW